LDEDKLTAEVYLSYDYQHETIMYTKNSNELIAPASLTKLMTALILYENYPLNHEFITSYPFGYQYSGKVAYIPSGIVLTTEELLELILIYSANDAAYIIANVVFGDYQKFIDEMNNKANKLSMDSTFFINPDGLDEKGHVTTANDLLNLTIYILENTRLLDITSKEDILIDKLDIKKFNSTNTIINEGYIGLKTGWTSNAGLTFIGFNQENNRQIITIVNNSIVDNEKTNHFIDTRILYNDSITNFKNIELLGTDVNLYTIRSGISNIKKNNNQVIKSFQFVQDNKNQPIITIENNTYQIKFQETNEIIKYKINTDNKIIYKFHWSSNILKNVFNR
tara:strand:+ start:1217 stop:2227 length:1011 start_codon:yes stop_codon:yes gene_type:complete